MASLNKVFLLGNLTRDPDMRYTPSGSAVCEFGMAISRRMSNQEREEVCFVDIIVWAKSAELCKQYLTKGSPVLIEGRLQLDQWEDRAGGGKRSRLRVVAERVQFIGTGRRNPDDPQGMAPASDSYNRAAMPRQSYGNAPQQPGSVRPQADGGVSPRPMPGMPPAPAMPPAEGQYNAPDVEDDIPF